MLVEELLGFLTKLRKVYGSVCGFIFVNKFIRQHYINSQILCKIDLPDYLRSF